MKSKIRDLLLFIVAVCPACFQRSHKYVNGQYEEKPNYVERVDSNGYVSTGIFNHDKYWGFDTDAFGAYKLVKSKEQVMNYDLLKMESPALRIFDTLSFRFDFAHLDSSHYFFINNEYIPALKRREIEKTNIQLVFVGKLINISGSTIYKYESFYKGQCYDWFVSDSIGFLKTYGPYDDLKTNINDYEIRFRLGSPKYYYAKKLLEAIKADKEFHTRCSAGELW